MAKISARGCVALLNLTIEETDKANSVSRSRYVVRSDGAVLRAFDFKTSWGEWARGGFSVTHKLNTDKPFDRARLEKIAKELKGSRTNIITEKYLVSKWHCNVYPILMVKLGYTHGVQNTLRQAVFNRALHIARISLENIEIARMRHKSSYCYVGTLREEVSNMCRIIRLEGKIK